jgi:chromosome segregation ATPase
MSRVDSKDSVGTQLPTKVAAKQHGEARTERVRQQVREAMAQIEAEMASNGGIYPHRNGSLSAAEVARRAKVHVTSFHTEKLSELGNEVRVWLKQLAHTKVVGSVRAKKNLADRLVDWQRLYAGLEQSHRDTELQLQQVEHELEQARGALAELKRENQRLLAVVAELSQKKVVAIRRKID